MNSETSTSPFPTSATTGTSGSAGSASTGGSNVGGMGADSMGGADNGTVQRLAQRAHEAVDRLEQTIGSGSDKMMGWQQEYGDMAREQVRESPLAAIGVAFAIGILFSKLFMR